MKTIWKFEIKPMHPFVQLPKNAEVLCVQTQNDKPFIWALVDSENELEERCFEIFGTGSEIHTDMAVDRKYIGTFQLYDGGLVFHLFERLN